MNWKAINYWLTLIADFFEFIPLIIIAYMLVRGIRFTGLKASTNILSLYIFASFSIKMLSNIRFFNSENNLIFYAVLGVVEVVLLAAFYLIELEVSKKKLLAILLLLLVFDLFLVLSQSTEVFNSLQWSFNSLVLMLLSLLMFYKYYERADHYPSHTSMVDATFIVNIGFLFYSAGSFFIYLMAWYVLAVEKPVNFFENGWIIVSLVTIVRTVFLSVYFFRVMKNK